MSDSQIQQFKDSRGFDFLMLASEAGRVDVVQNLIDRGEEVDFEVDGVSAINLAENNHEVTLALLKANSKFPLNFQHQNEPDELNSFLDLGCEMHDRVKEMNEDDCEEVKNFLREKIEANPTLRHFYDPRDNFSLLKRAILCKNFSIYEFLLSLNIFLAPHESMHEINKNLTEDERQELSEINFQISPSLMTEPMMILMRNCKLSPDSPKHRQGEFMGFIREAFESLFMIPAIAIVLKIVAASRNFKIVFDFKRDSVNFLDPRSESYCDGLFILSNKIYKIYVGAKDMLDLRTAHKVVGVLAHELTHYCMFLVYNNRAKPYKENDLKTEARFDEIFNECKRVKKSEEIVDLVYTDYEEEVQHTELIVRVPHMMALYLNKLQILKQKRKFFRSLFDFYEQSCVPQMEKELPNIERRFCPIKRAEKSVKRQKRWIFFLIISIVIGSILSALLITSLLPISWAELDESEKEIVKNSSVDFYGVDVKFGELFANDSKAYEMLSTKQIKGALKGDPDELSKFLNLTLHHHVYLHWSNMTRKLRQRFLMLEVNFQNHKMQMQKVTKNDLTLEALNWPQIRQTFVNGSLKISSSIHEKVKIYIERFFADKKLTVVSEQHYNTLKDSKGLVEFYKNGKVDVNSPNVKSFDEIQSSKIFLLSSSAGDGKSTTFRHFSVKLKEKFPQNWIQYVDLKKHVKPFEIGQKLDLRNFEILSKFLGQNLLNLDNFELELFKELFASGKVIFLWDGVDEIASRFKDLIIELTENILNANNSQFIATRPQLAKD